MASLNILKEVLAAPSELANTLKIILKSARSIRSRSQTTSIENQAEVDLSEVSFSSEHESKVRISSNGIFEVADEGQSAKKDLSQFTKNNGKSIRERYGLLSNNREARVNDCQDLRQGRAGAHPAFL